MSEVDDAVGAFAEDPDAYVALGPGEERILTDRYCLTFTPGAHFWSTSVQRLRFDIGDVAEVVREIRRLVADRGRAASVWTVGPSSPDGLAEALPALGLELESGAGSAVLALTDRPSVRDSAFEVRVVATFEDHLAAIETANAGFGFAPADADDERRRAAATFEAERGGRRSFRLLALDRERPVATGRAWCSPFGIYLGGGATLPSDRGRGAMSAVVGAAWEEAVRRATPALVTFGGERSRSPLERLGFRRLGSVLHMIDSTGSVTGA